MSNSLSDRRGNVTATGSLKSVPGTENVLRNRKDRDTISLVSQQSTFALLDPKAKLKPKLGGNKNDKEDDDDVNMAEVSSLLDSICCVREKFVLLICQKCRDGGFC